MKCSYFWLIYIRRRSRRLFTKILPCFRLESLLFFNFTWDFYNPLPSRQENLGFFPLLVKRLYLWLNYITRRLRGLLQGPVIILIKSPLLLFFSYLFYSFSQGFILLLEDLMVPKRTKLKVSGHFCVFLSSFPSDSLRQLHDFWHYCYSFSMDST